MCFEKDEKGKEPKKKLIGKQRETMKDREIIKRKELEKLNELYKQLKQHYSDWDLPTSNKNLFVNLMQEIATELGLSKCFVCGGLRMAEKWPWRGEGLAPEQFLKWNHTQISKTLKQPEGWVLSHQVIGTVCITQKGRKYTAVVRYTPCLSTLVVNSDNNTKTWRPKSPTGYWEIAKEMNCKWNNQTNLCWHNSSGANPYQSIKDLKSYWEQPENTKEKPLMKYIGFVDNEHTVNYPENGRELVP